MSMAYTVCHAHRTMMGYICDRGNYDVILNSQGRIRVLFGKGISYSLVALVTDLWRYLVLQRGRQCDPPI